MKTIAIIPARAGSKRIPGKNIKPIAGKPLLAYTIEQAVQADCFSDVIVSTDDNQVAEVALRYGASVPWLRSPELASDEASVVDAVIEALTRLKASQQLVDRVMLLQPTSPLRSVQSIQKALQLPLDFPNQSVISVSMAETHPLWCKTIDQQGNLQAFLPEQPLPVRSQDLPAVYQLNGLIYVAAVDTILQQKSFYTEPSKALLIEDRQETIDIDTPYDWMIAEAIMQIKKGI